MRDLNLLFFLFKWKESKKCKSQPQEFNLNYCMYVFTLLFVPSLVCGDVLGNFKQFFNRLETINKKNGPFEFVLCVGEFFSPSVNGASELEAYRNGNKHGKNVFPTHYKKSSHFAFRH